ncbi:MAG TPA: hypothetical protein VIV61_13155 [Candidatus Ozemobacteraceae bacterium]
MKQIITALFIGALFIMSGCGGGGGGDGRQVLPGENPLGPGAGTGTGTGTGTATDTTPIVKTPAENLADGWIDMGYTNYTSAADKFQTVINSSTSTAAQVAEAYNGLGWSRAKAYGMGSGISEFQQAGNLPESLVGLAFAYVQLSTGAGYTQSLMYFSAAGADTPTNVITLPHASLGITNGEIHAMYAYALAMTGNNASAAAQINAVWTPSTPAASPVGQIHSLLVTLGIPGINP